MKTYRGTDTITGYFVYGQLDLIGNKPFITDKEAGKVHVYPNSIILLDLNEVKELKR